MPKKWFRIPFARAAFLRLLAAHGVSLDKLDATTAVALMTEFHEQHGAQHTSHGGADELHVTNEPDGRLTIIRRMVRTDPDLARDLVLRVGEANSLELL